jgi:CubicO group peptidase (beta-lactamase class C family)
MGYLTVLLALLMLDGARVNAHVLPGPEPEGTVESVRAYLDTLEHAGFSGTVLVEFQGTLVISQGYGYSDLLERRKNSPHTVFDIGSVTKQFTAAAILKLETEGRLSTEDKLGRYFENVPPDKAGITIHHLLRHSSGLKSNIGRDYDSITVAAFVDSVLKSQLRFPCGTTFSYSNIGYSLLGIIVEKVSGMSYEAYLYRSLWQPAGMEYTGYRRPNFDAKLIATGYHYDDEVWGKPTEKRWDVNGPFWHLKGNGGILSTTEDLLKWDRALATDRILSDSAKAKMYHPTLGEDDDRNSYYGYGWDVHKTRRNTMLYWHNGSNGIFFADFYRFVDEGATVIVLANKSNGIEDAGREIARAFLDSSYRPVVPVLDNEPNRRLTDHAILVTLQDGIEAGGKELQGRKPGVNLLEQRVNRRGYELLNSGNAREAICVFRLNVLAFPTSANAYDSIGEAYMVAGDSALALENYRTSLALDPGNGNAEKMLKRLLGK